MQFSTYAKTLAAALSVVVIAGCSSGGGTQDNANGGMSSGNGTASSSGAAGQGYGDGAGNGSASDADSIPSVRTIYFDFDRDTIRPEFESVLNQHAAYLKAHPSAHVTLQGHTDPTGTREYNLGLGERRANSIRQYLAVQGVDGSQVDVVSYGEERPAAAGHSPDAYAQDRRVVFDY